VRVKSIIAVVFGVLLLFLSTSNAEATLTGVDTLYLYSDTTGCTEDCDTCWTGNWVNMQSSDDVYVTADFISLFELGYFKIDAVDTLERDLDSLAYLFEGKTSTSTREVYLGRFYCDSEGGYYACDTSWTLTTDETTHRIAILENICQEPPEPWPQNGWVNFFFPVDIPFGIHSGAGTWSKGQVVSVDMLAVIVYSTSTAEPSGQVIIIGRMDEENHNPRFGKPAIYCQ